MADKDAFISRLISVFRALEEAFRRADPLMLEKRREGLLAEGELLRSDLCSAGGPGHEDPQSSEALRAADKALEAVDLFGTGDDMTQAFMNVLRAYRKFARAQEILFPLRHRMEEVDRFFRVEARNASDGDPGENTDRIFHNGMDDDPYARDGFSLYVPEHYHDGRAWPLIIAFHGGYGHGRDFIWTWIREARTRGCFVLSPTSAGRTWAIGLIEPDAKHLMKHLDKVTSKYRIDPARTLLTGMSDGATFSLGLGLRESSPFQAIAPVSGVLPPVDLPNARGKRIYWVHGEQDWMFPVGRAVHACRMLKEAGAEVTLKVIHDLSHAYPIEQNGGILDWFDRSS